MIIITHKIIVDELLKISDLPENEQMQALFVAAHLASIIADQPIVKPLGHDTLVYEIFGINLQETEESAFAFPSCKGKDILLTWIDSTMKIEGMANALSKIEQLRIGNIETEIKETDAFIYLWFENDRLGKEQEYLDDGYIVDKDPCFLIGSGHRIDRSFFVLKELKMMIASLHYDDSDSSTTMETVGGRVLNLSNSDRVDFFDVYQLANDKLCFGRLVDVTTQS
jgi:hypothetical protein